MATDLVLPFTGVAESFNSPGFSVTNAALRPGAVGIAGGSAAGIGVLGTSTVDLGIQNVGVQGKNSQNGAMGFLAGRDPIFKGVVGVYGESSQNGVFGRTASAVPEDNAVYGQNDGAGHGVTGVSHKGIGIVGASNFGLAAKFIGNVNVTGTLTGGGLDCSGKINTSASISAFDVVLHGADCAEDFDIAGPDTVDPGTVMVIHRDGTLRPCHDSYDRKVTGVISGAGDYKPGIVLDKQPSTGNRLPLALVGKVYCKVDAAFGPVEVGDLLTTSTTHGHAMKANDPAQAFGAVIGKALTSLITGRGLIPILVALQ
jgi:hypothetical protein